MSSINKIAYRSLFILVDLGKMGNISKFTNVIKAVYCRYHAFRLYL